jgi:hypothetical protein
MDWSEKKKKLKKMEKTKKERRGNKRGVLGVRWEGGERSCRILFC